MKYNIEDRKTRVKIGIGITSILLIIIVWLQFERHEIKSHSIKILSTVSSRNIDRKGNVSIEANFEFNNVIYRSVRVVTGYEERNNLTIEEGDSVIVEFSYRDPSFNKIILKNIWYD